jgi:hypothetical protein
MNKTRLHRPLTKFRSTWSLSVKSVHWVTKQLKLLPHPFQAVYMLQQWDMDEELDTIIDFVFCAWRASCVVVKEFHFKWNFLYNAYSWSSNKPQINIAQEIYIETKSQHSILVGNLEETRPFRGYVEWSRYATGLQMNTQIRMSRWWETRHFWFGHWTPDEEEMAQNEPDHVRKQRERLGDSGSTVGGDWNFSKWDSRFWRQQVCKLQPSVILCV